jgi:hypothetical protein
MSTRVTDTRTSFSLSWNQVMSSSTLSLCSPGCTIRPDDIHDASDYTKDGARLSCSESEGSMLSRDGRSREDIKNMVEEHYLSFSVKGKLLALTWSHQITEKEISNKHAEVYSSTIKKLL